MYPFRKRFEKRMKIEGCYTGYEKRSITQKNEVYKLLKYGHILSGIDKEGVKYCFWKIGRRYFRYKTPTYKGDIESGLATSLERCTKKEICEDYADLQMHIHVFAMRKHIGKFLYKLSRDREISIFQELMIVNPFENGIFNGNFLHSLYVTYLVAFSSDEVLSAQINLFSMINISEIYTNTLKNLADNNSSITDIMSEDCASEYQNIDNYELMSEKEYNALIREMVSAMQDIKKQATDIVRNNDSSEVLDTKDKIYLKRNKEQNKFMLWSVWIIIIITSGFSSVRASSPVFAVIDFCISIFLYLNNCVTNKERDNEIIINRFHTKMFYPTKNDGIRLFLMIAFVAIESFGALINLNTFLTVGLALPFSLLYLRSFRNDMKKKYPLDTE